MSSNLPSSGPEERDAGEPAVPPRVLIVKMSSLGDLFHALPAVHRLKAALSATIDWVVQPEYAELVRCFSDVERVVVFPRRDLPGKAMAFLRDLRSQSYDLVVDLQGLLKSAVPARLARGGKVIGPSSSREGARFLYHDVAGHRNKERHAVEEGLDIIRYFGIEDDTVAFPVVFPKAALEEPRPHVALLPRSRWATKNWPVESFAQLGRNLVKDTAATLFVLGSEADRDACEQLVAMVDAPDRVVSLCGRTTLVELGSLLQEVDLAVTVDSGPMHMAAAVGARVLALFGPTDPVRTGPYGKGHRVLRIERLACSPCHSDDCVREDLACMKTLFPSGVTDAALEMLRAPYNVDE